ncbi:MAG: two-component regulator propeller domain-containing protein [Paludibacter sp.]
MKKSISFCLLLWLHTFCLTFAAIDINSTHFTTNDGLSNNFVRHIFQDSKGYLWLSSINGLTRYDGHTFVSFQPDKGDKITLFDHHVRNVSEDKNHFLWIQLSPDNYSCYDLTKEQFVDFTGTGDFKRKFSNRFEASNGDIWVWKGNEGCRKLTFADGKFQPTLYSIKNGKLPSNNIGAIAEDTRQNIFIGTDNGLVILSNGKSKIIRDIKRIYAMQVYGNTVFVLTKDGLIYKLSLSDYRVQLLAEVGDKNLSFPSTTGFVFHNNWVILTPGKGTVLNLKQGKIISNNTFNITNGNFVTDKKGNICLFNNKGIVRFINNKTGKVKEFQITIKDLTSDRWCKIIQDSRGWEWFATFGDGLYVYNPATDEISHFRYQVDANNLICSNSLTNIMEDRSGAIWIASESAGVSRLNVRANNVGYLYPEDRSIINNTNSIRLIHQLNNGEIWIGNRDGNVYRYDTQLKSQLKKSHFESSIYALQDEGAGKILIGSRSSGLYVDNKWITKGNNASTLPSEKISLFFKDYKGRTWVGTFSGGLALMIHNKDTYTFKRFFSENNELFSARSIASDKNHWMWLGNDNGLYVFHPDSLIANPRKFYRYNYDNGSLLANRVKFVFRDSKNRFWLGTMGGGLSCCKPGENYGKLNFTHYTTNNGLTNNVVQSIQEDQQGKIWVATEYGISRLTPETNSIENFFFSKSIQGNVYNESSALRLPDNRLLFGTYHGVVVIDPTHIKSPNTIANVILTDLKVNGISMHPGDEDSPLTSAIAYSDKVELKHYQSSITVEFSTFDYLSDKKTKYSYKLESYDNDWSTPTQLNFASYKKLPAGKYTLRIRACNSAGVWSKQEARLQIIVHPPFWASFWAYLLYIIILTAIIYMVFRILHNFNRLQSRISLEKELTDYKLLFFTNISHEFRTPLTLIKGAIERLENTNSTMEDIAYPIQLMRKSTDRLLRLVNQLMEFRKMQNNKLSLMLDKQDVVAFCQDIYRNFEETAKDKQITVRFNTNTPEYEMYFDNGKLDKIVYNLLSNAFKYTPQGGSVDVELEIKPDQNQCRIIVSDTGMGIPVEKRQELFSRFMQTSFSNDSVGIGLHLTHELVNVHKGSIAYKESPQGTGSVFTVTLPTDQSAYKAEDFIAVAEIPEKETETIANKSETTKQPLQLAEGVAPGHKVLVIEDDVEVRRFMEKELSVYFNVSTASDGIAGLEAAKNFDGDLIVCDVMMPGMNGFEVTRELKSNFDTSHIPIILLTALSTAENQLEGTQTGADAYITKPFSTKLLIARMQQLIEQREKLRDKYAKDTTVKTPVVTTSELDKRFADKLNLLMDKHLDDPDFSLDDFSEKLGLGRTVFFRKVKGVTGYTPNEYMRVYRLRKAMELLQEGKYNVSEVTFMVGLNDPLYFSRCFKKQFGIAPSIYLRGDKSTQ